MPDGVKVADFGIRGVHLAYELLDGFDSLVLVDAVPLGDDPGTLAVIEPDLDSLRIDEARSHGRSQYEPGGGDGHPGPSGRPTESHLVVGCQPAKLDEGMGLSPQVAAAVAPAVDLCCRGGG